MFKIDNKNVKPTDRMNSPIAIAMIEISLLILLAN